MRAHGWRWGLWRAFGTADALPHRPSPYGSVSGLGIRHFLTHSVVGHAFPLGFWCLLCILPDAFADWTFVPQLGQAWVNARTTSPCRTRNCLPQCPATWTLPVRMLLCVFAWQYGHSYSFRSFAEPCLRPSACACLCWRSSSGSSASVFLLRKLPLVSSFQFGVGGMGGSP